MDSTAWRTVSFVFFLGGVFSLACTAILLVLNHLLVWSNFHTPELRDVVNNFEPTTTGMKEFRGHLLNVDTNELYFSISTDLKAEEYFSALEQRFDGSAYSILDGEGDARAYGTERGFLRVSYFAPCSVHVFYSPSMFCAAEEAG